MKDKTCSRSWEVEAARDGRLSETATILLSQHVARCEVCSREQRSLAALKERLKTGLPDEVDELRVRRMRREILEQANRTLIEQGSAKPRPRHKVFVPAFAFAVALALVLFGWKGLLDGGPLIQVTEGNGADWSQEHTANAERVVLREGVIELRIRRNAGDASVFVVVPDGEIEDVGTVFRVEVKSGTTRAIDVTEGAVLFHRSNEPDVRINAGEHWPNSDPSAASLVEVPSASQSATQGPSPTPSGEPKPDVSAGAPPSRERETPHSKASASGSGSANGSGSGSGNATGNANATANATSKPSATDGPAANVDNLEEDIAYLRVIALLREGRKDEAKLAAKDYLRRFPKGFRRVEVAAIAK